ncbi:restriction endonuclease [candidate division KSB1 bacterium]|nr:MAG: restriction endonuclease [candidate division KSB1 bacterium]
MSIARHHADWLSLVEVSGPFMSMPVLMRVFPQGLDAHEPDPYKILRNAYEEWQDNQGGVKADPKIHQEWIDYVLQETLEYPSELLLARDKIPDDLKVRVSEQRETLCPDIVLTNPSDQKPRVLIQVYPVSQGLDKIVPGKDWKASPATRMMELLYGTGVRLGIVTNGEHWMLVHALKGETTTFTSWYAALWFEEQITLRAFRSLLCKRRLFGVADNETLEALFTESAQNQQEVTEQLGNQVRKAVEVLVQAVDRSNKDRKGGLLEGITEQEVYDAALTVMMRLVFLFSAEERGLLLLGDPLYDLYYAVSTLRAQLREEADQHGEEVLERRLDAWCRLLATFRAVYGGIDHDRMRLPAYGGKLFSPDRYPFLEGRPKGTSWKDTQSVPLPINNRTVLHLLEALQILQMPMPGGGPKEARRLSFRALDIEQIGHVYEGLLDHTAVRAASPVLGLTGTRGKEEEIPLEELERLHQRGIDDLADYLHDLTGRSAPAIKRALTNPPLLDDQRLLVACENDQALVERVRPYAALLREDTQGYPTVIVPGSVYVTQGSDRRTTGTHYTPRTLTEEIVKYALEPLVYEGPADGKPREEWNLKSARELLALKICDFAMGSGAFLVQACRYLSELLLEAWGKAKKEAGTRPIVTPFGDPSEGRPEERVIPLDNEDEALTIARRIIADRCLYGVDKNPMAVEMAKLSLWLITLAKGRPFEFLDHSLKCGDSLLGVTDPRQVENFHINPDRGKELHAEHLAGFYTTAIHAALQKAAEFRKKLEDMATEGVTDTAEKERLLREADIATDQVRLLADLVIAAAFKTAGQREGNYNSLVQDWLEKAGRVLSEKTSDDDRVLLLAELEELVYDALNSSEPRIAAGQLQPRRTFHWAVEFPEVFANGRIGFDTILSNPPFSGGQHITGQLGIDYREHMVCHIANDRRGSADLFAYFYLRASLLVAIDGIIGMLASNSISQVTTREVGLDQLVLSNCSIIRAIPSRPWPGTAALEIACVWICKGRWAGEFVLENKGVSGITSFLRTPGKVLGMPLRLKANERRAFIGSTVHGKHFLLSEDEARLLFTMSEENHKVVYRFLNGEDLTSRPDQSPSRWIANFHDWPLSRAFEGSWSEADERQRTAWLRNGFVPSDYPGPVAEDFPDCLRIVRTKYEAGTVSHSDVDSQENSAKWWRYHRTAPNLYEAVSGMSRVFVTALTSKHFIVVAHCPDIVFSHAVGVFAFDTFNFFALLQSSIHQVWVVSYQSSLETRGRYTPSDCFETYPLPKSTKEIDDIGSRYHNYRTAIMKERSEGLTGTYNRFHDRDEKAGDIQQLRELQIEMDKAVAQTYGWSDLQLEHGFHATKQGVRFTISEKARREVLDRLLKLNHERHAEEVAQGLWDVGKKKPSKRAAKAKVANQPDILDNENT